jgi:hypothetical protein
MREIGKACACLAVAASSAGCSFITLSGAQGHLPERTDRAQCAAWILAPMTDAALGLVLGTIGLTVNSLGGGEQSIPFVFAGGTFVASTVYGGWAMSRCAEHNESLSRHPRLPRLTVDTARQTLDDASAQFAVCGASTEPVRIALAVDADGRVVRTHVYPPVDPARAQCIATVAKTIAFPPSATGLIVAHDLAW